MRRAALRHGRCRAGSPGLRSTFHHVRLPRRAHRCHWLSPAAAIALRTAGATQCRRASDVAGPRRAIFSWRAETFIRSSHELPLHCSMPSSLRSAKFRGHRGDTTMNVRQWLFGTVGRCRSRACRHVRAGAAGRRRAGRGKDGCAVAGRKSLCALRLALRSPGVLARRPLPRIYAPVPYYYPQHPYYYGYYGPPLGFYWGGGRYRRHW
jgi:hypothetical protein